MKLVPKPRMSPAVEAVAAAAVPGRRSCRCSGLPPGIGRRTGHNRRQPDAPARDVRRRAHRVSRSRGATGRSVTARVSLTSRGGDSFEIWAQSPRSRPTRRTLHPQRVPPGHYTLTANFAGGPNPGPEWWRRAGRGTRQRGLPEPREARDSGRSRAQSPAAATRSTSRSRSRRTRTSRARFSRSPIGFRRSRERFRTRRAVRRRVHHHRVPV